ncbi:hypothetical protein [Nonomuraea sp. B19D2]|uniref:hypothetical protein n=1 Tax=Nonomuraea sp. B19D2 TaxID=3159561 RepID=UPI0032DB416D
MERTMPFGMLCPSLTILWYATYAHRPADAAERRARARWYTTKTEPSFEDMVIKLRRVIIAERFGLKPPTRPHPKKPRPSSQPGPPPKHDVQKCETRGLLLWRTSSFLPEFRVQRVGPAVMAERTTYIGWDAAIAVS